MTRLCLTYAPKPRKIGLMADPNIHIDQRAEGSSGVTQIGVQYTGGVHHHYAPGSEPPRTTVTLELAQEQVDISRLVALIAGLAQAGVQDIKLVGVRLGSLFVTLDMPTPAARRLGDLAVRQPELFAEFALVSISIDLPPPPAAPPGRPPDRPRPPRATPSPWKALVSLLRRLLQLIAIVVAGGAIIIVISIINQPSEPRPPAVSPCRAVSTDGQRPIFAAPLPRQIAIAELGDGDGLAVTGRLADGTWWQVAFDGQQGWVRGPDIRLTGDCGEVPVIAPPGEPGQIEPGPRPEACIGHVTGEGDPERPAGAVYAEPAYGAGIVIQLPENTTVRLLDAIDGGWWRIFSETADVEGWMHQSTLVIECE